MYGDSTRHKIARMIPLVTVGWSRAWLIADATNAIVSSGFCEASYATSRRSAGTKTYFTSNSAAFGMTK